MWGPHRPYTLISCLVNKTWFSCYPRCRNAEKSSIIYNGSLKSTLKPYVKHTVFNRKPTTIKNTLRILVLEKVHHVITSMLRTSGKKHETRSYKYNGPFLLSIEWYSRRYSSWHWEIKAPVTLLSVWFSSCWLSVLWSYSWWNGSINSKIACITSCAVRDFLDTYYIRILLGLTTLILWDYMGTGA